jgi:hypothetical protein
MNPLQYREGGRGTGKTTRLIKATPRGGIYVVSSAKMVHIIERYLGEIKRTGDLKIISVESAHRDLKGVRAPIAIDHTVFEEGALQEDLAFYLTYAPLILTNDYEGDVITSYKRVD